MSTPVPYAFERDRLLGTLFEVGPNECRAVLRRDSVAEGRWLHGAKFPGGRVGEFVVIECSEHGIFGKITHITLPERERRNFEDKPEDIHPVATVQLLTTFSPASAEASGGIVAHPLVGNGLFSANPRLVKALAESGRSPGKKQHVVFQIGSLPDGDDVSVALTPERLFGRHCAVLGTTGGGKSYTIAHLAEEAMKHRSKILLLDATGEFHTLKGPVSHFHLGGVPLHGETTVVLPHTELTESDLFALFTPSPGVQAPKLRAAFKSLKLAGLEATLAPQGCIVKAGQKRAAYDAAFVKHAASLQLPKAVFDIAKLNLQIDAECVWPTGFLPNRQPDTTAWGGPDDAARGHCVSLMARIETLTAGAELACVFKPAAAVPSILTKLDEFLANPAARIMRVSLRDLSFAYGTREIVANALGRHLMELARAGKFTGSVPLVVMLDEAHQFLNKRVGDEVSSTSLDAFELIAKEGRKHWLTICMATQRPRDIPEGVLSQMGTLIVHRLTNSLDRTVVERAAGQLDQSAAEFLPTLAPGEAAIIGIDFPIPLTVQISKPTNHPSSTGPMFQEKWANPPPAPA